jgi:hypothetical protein
MLLDFYPSEHVDTLISELMIDALALEIIVG